jgi:hypothetical protein
MMQNNNTNLQLKKKVRNPPLSIQVDKGRYAFKKGWLGNPYDPDTAQGKEWQRGFDAAYFEHLDKIKLV